MTSFQAFRVVHSWLLLCSVVLVAIADEPFPQPISHKYLLPTELRGQAQQVAIDQDGIVYIATTKGIARLFGHQIALDHSYRPMAGKVATEISVRNGELFYLFPSELLSNRRAGKFVQRLEVPHEHFAVNESGTALLTLGAKATLLKDRYPAELPGNPPVPFNQVLAFADSFLARAGDAVYRVTSNVLKIAEVPALNVIALHDNKLYAGSARGLVALDPANGREMAPLNSRLPFTNIAALASSATGLWAGTTRGLWIMSTDRSFRYFASKRWLDDDEVLDLAIAPNGNVFALTKNAVNEIEFRQMTLAEKAMWYENKIRQRHIRYGFCAELRLRMPGDITTAEMIDTDNDGTWSNYYMASQAFRFGATGEPEARRNAWETFEALERLESINPLGGFPSRTFERTGFKVSDPDRWHEVGDGLWDWKAHTSSDEITAHMFGSAVLYETTAKTAAEKQRIAIFVGKILDHIIRNNWYLIDVDGQPTLWARWNPEYVNGFPETMYDRRLNSAEIIAALQFGHAITGKQLYKDKAFELMEKHGYLRNIMLPMSAIDYTPGFKHKGIEMGMDWNHSDDLLGFVTYWVLHRFAFNDELRAKYTAAIQDHWNFERVERCPLWNFVYASTGPKEFGLEDALWTLRGFPLDMIDWSVANSHRGDITRLPANFRFQELKELLPPDERRVTRWNGQPFVLNGGSGGTTELAGDEFLLPYWMGRYLKLID
jgi:hypothetical protein